MRKYWLQLCSVMLLLNLWFWAWSNGHLRIFGMGPIDPRETQRLEEQVNPEALQLLVPSKKP